MMNLRRILASAVLVLVLTGLSLSTVQAAAMMPHHSAQMAQAGVPDCDGCADAWTGPAGCATVCAPCHAGDPAQVSGGPAERLASFAGDGAPGVAVPPDVVLSPDPPRPKPRSF